MFPIYIISKGRSADVMPTGTTGHLSKFEIPHFIMVEPQEKERYEKYKTPYATILTIPQEERDKDHERWCDWSKRNEIVDGKEVPREQLLGAAMGMGAVASRNSTKRHAKESGAKAFWNMDDNATGFFKWMTIAELNHYKCWHALQQDEKIPVEQRALVKNLKKWGVAKVSMSRFLNGTFTEKNKKTFDELRDFFNSQKDFENLFTEKNLLKDKNLNYSIKYDISAFKDCIPNYNIGDKVNESETVRKIFFDDFEPNLFKIDNMGFIGFNTVDACPRCVAQYLIRPMGRRVYSCTLMKTDYPLEWWGQTSDDVLLNIDCLCNGYWMACLWRWVMGKPMTQTTKGGCTDNAYGRAEGETMKLQGAAEKKDKTYAASTYPKTKFITSMYPQYLNTKSWKRRIHHEFLWDKIPNPKVELDLSIKVPRSSIEYLYPIIKEEYKKAKKTKEELTKVPLKPQYDKNHGKGFGALGLELSYVKEVELNDEIYQEGGDDYQPYFDSMDTK